MGVMARMGVNYVTCSYNLHPGLSNYTQNRHQSVIGEFRDGLREKKIWNNVCCFLEDVVYAYFIMNYASFPV